MKQILTIAMLLTSLASYAQDTLCVMVCLDRVLHFDYSTNEIIDKEYTSDEVEIKVEDDEILVLHFYDKKRRFRDVTATFSDGDHMHDVFNTRNKVLYSKNDWPSFVINISKPRRKK
tara:strand:+ start:84 stop:434 length:351 start_codon:yes stop_codon:yes gene_type:complete